MADEAFALSPIAARPVQPGEADYDAIREAFMETSRGRWFLGEYAKRNRNADTSMVLDAVARIEETLAAQRQPAVENKLPEALAAIRTAVELAEDAASRALDDLRLEDSLAPIRKGVRIIREISWRWREIGADGRICDLIDSQVSAIEAGCGQIAECDPKAALGNAFDLIKTRIDAFGEAGEAGPPDAEDDAAPPPFAGADDDIDIVHMQASPAVEPAGKIAAAPSAEAAPSPAPVGEPGVSAANELDAVAVSSAEQAVETIDVPVETAEAPLEPINAPVETVEAPVEAITVTPAPAGVSWHAGNGHDADRDDDVPDDDVHHAAVDEADAQDADAHDEAVLKLVAIEMAAPDPAGADEAPTNDEDLYVSTRPLIEPMVVAREPGEPMAVPPSRPFVQPPPVTLVPSPEPPSKPAFDLPSPLSSNSNPASNPSLGSSLLANGIVQSKTPANDPLAPIRRMSQAEKIAFFS